MAAPEFQRVQYVARASRLPRGGYREVAKIYNAATHKLPSAWPSLAQDVKEALTDIAYAIIEPPAPNFVQSFRGRLIAAWTVFSGKADEFMMAYEAALDFAEAVLALQEQEDADLQQAVAERLRSLSRATLDSLPTFEEFKERVLGS